MSLSNSHIEKIRVDFPILSQKMRGKDMIFLDNAASSQKPTQVVKAIDDYYYQSHANVHRGVYELSQKATDAFELGREKVRAFINAATTEEVIFVKGTTEGINLVASSFGQKYIRKGDEIVISTMEHHSNIVPWQLLCERTEAVLKVIPIDDDGELMMDAYENLLSDKTKIVAVTHVSNTLGTINPVAEIINIAHNRNIPVLLDGAQAAPHMNINVQDLDVDFYVFSAHKMYGPTGIGVLYGKKKWLDTMPPYQGGGEMIANVTFEKSTYTVLPFKFEAGTPDISGVVGLGAAIDYIDDISIDNIAKQEQILLDHGTKKLLEIDGLRIIGNAQHKAGVISFVVEGIHPYDIGTLLDKLGIAVRTGHHCTQPLMERFGISGTVRASFAVYNTIEEVDLFVAGVTRVINMLK